MGVSVLLPWPEQILSPSVLARIGSVSAEAINGRPVVDQYAIGSALLSPVRKSLNGIFLIPEIISMRCASSFAILTFIVQILCLAIWPYICTFYHIVTLISRKLLIFYSRHICFCYMVRTIAGLWATNYYYPKSAGLSRLLQQIREWYVVCCCPYL